jgi:hypothetical protein
MTLHERAGVVGRSARFAGERIARSASKVWAPKVAMIDAEVIRLKA